DIAEGEWVSAEAMYARKILDTHKVTAGAEYQLNLKQLQNNYNESPYYLYLHDNTKSNRWALYLQDEYSILDNLILNAGLRHDYYYTFGSSTNPRIALIYAPAKTTAIKLIYGTAFRAPNNYELYYHDNINLGANPELKPETIKTYELVLEQYLGKHLRGTAAAFYNDIRDLIQQQSDPYTGVLVFRNTDRVVAKGLEFEVDGVWNGGYRARASYTVQEAKDRTTNITPVNSPKHLAKLNVTFPIWSDKIFGGAEEQFSSSRRTLLGDSTGCSYVTNVTIFSQKIIRNLEFSGSIYNLFDQKYGDPGAEEHREDLIEQNGRTFRLKLTYKF
ncbi:MAG: TonB-dependent receptor, partial [Nitrospirae bacterium]|nr:TonB-dependent receptor [Nitrospirota bacterium]